MEKCHVVVSVYWTRAAVGVKIIQENGKQSQKYYFSRVFNSIAINICQAMEMAYFLKDKAWNFVDTNVAECEEHYFRVQMSAAVAADRFEEMKAQKLAAAALEA